MLSTFDYSWTTKAATQPVGIKEKKKKKEKEEMIKKSAMAPIWQVGESARSARRQPSQAAGPARPSGKGVDSTLPLLHPAPSSTEPSVCQDKQMRRHMLERLLENYWGSFRSRTRWKEVRNPVLHTVTAFYALYRARVSCGRARAPLKRAIGSLCCE